MFGLIWLSPEITNTILRISSHSMAVLCVTVFYRPAVLSLYAFILAVH